MKNDDQEEIFNWNSFRGHSSRVASLLVFYFNPVLFFASSSSPLAIRDRWAEMGRSFLLFKLIFIHRDEHFWLKLLFKCHNQRKGLEKFFFTLRWKDFFSLEIHIRSAWVLHWNSMFKLIHNSFLHLQIMYI